MEWRETDDRVRWLEAELPGARAAFSTRLGGVSEPPFDSLNLGLLTDDERSAVTENRRRLGAALGFTPEQVVHGLQVHGAELAVHASSLGEVPEVDGHVVSRPGLAALVFAADCLPVALAGPGGVAMLHCGWRGLAAGIVAKGAEAVGATAAAIGPGIGPCCYEVGEEVLEALGVAADGPKSRARDDISARRHLDLGEVARRLLADDGVAQVESAGLCTSCNPELFYSHRRDEGRTGRQAGLAWIEEA
jgi:YfiH family protein